MWFQKLSIPPPWKGFFSRPPPSPHPSRNSSQASNTYLNFGPLKTPHPQEFPIPSVGGVWIFSGTTQCKEDHHTKKCNLHTVGSCETKPWKHPDLDSDLDGFSKLHCNWKLVINWLEHCTSIAEVRVGIQANLNFSGFLFATFYQSASLTVMTFSLNFISSSHGSNKWNSYIHYFILP